ncbi:S8 family peptidase [Streptomyces sp. SID13726]|uniref:S8 family peptidase n=1 Tax=Streptomyces sp. SID13726 TaxID=2706058 RepID=UPI0013B98A71|nr:S8 family peptidase [Streptomyces sp. SID13726]NEB02255.1 S8 family serine peptidase [Streptomyces sp. SID13726]
MTEPVQPPRGPGPDGAGFTYRGAERELIVVARPEARLRAGAEGVRSAAGADVSALDLYLHAEQLSLEPLFGGEERVRRSVGEGAPDLARFYRVRGGADRADELRAGIAVLPGVDTAYVKPPAVPATVADDEHRLNEGAPGPQEGAPRLQEGAPGPTEGPPLTPDFTGRQGYLRPAPEGVDAHWAWLRPGGTGRGVTVIDVEGAWQLGHEDLAAGPAGVVVGTPLADLAWRNHGTAVLGVLGGAPGGPGVTGIVPEAVTAAASFQGLGTAAAIHAAAGRLGPGDVVLVGLHRPGPRFGHEVREDQRGCVPVEWWPDDFAAVRFATARGVLVVAAGGNGGECLDDAVYERRPDDFPQWWRNPFNPAHPSSGAVLVGAGAPPPGTHGRDHGPDRSRLAFSNHGARVDAQGWGREVTTTGGSWDRPGDLQGGPEEIAWYTDTFSGTSAAAAQVVGALAALQGMLKAAAQPPMTPERARTVLRATGSPQQDAPGRPAAQRIGNRPDIRAAVTRLLPDAVGSGQAERYWDELLPYPSELPPRLRLFVSGAWRSLNHPSPEIRQAVHAAFASGRPDVRVWFSDDEIVGLVVAG